jgi:hypothetical protein
VLAELPAVDGRGPVELWVYVSRDCTGGTRPIRLGVRDTHRSPAAEVELSANLTPLEVLAPRVLNARLDTDDLGSSDGSRKKEVAPGLRFEFSLDLALPTVEAAAVRMSYAAPKDLQPLFAAFAYREVPLGRDTDRIFRAADDLDVTIVGSKAFEAAILQARASRRWVTGRWPARLWLAVDATIDVNRPGEKSPVQPPSPKVAPPSPPAGEKVVALVRRHLSLAPHPVPIVLPDSVAAASGFEISFDASRFAEDYNALAWPAASPAGTPETVREPLRYRYRLYQSLPLMAGGVPDPPPPVAARTAPRTAPAPKAPPVVEAPPSEARQFALDIGGTWTGYTAAAGVDTTLFGSSSLIDVASFSARLMYGTEWVGIVRFGIGMDGRTNDRAAAVHFRETTAEAGAGYLWSLAPSVDLVARGTFLLNFRSLDGSGSAICPAIEAGLTLRGKVTEGFGLYGDLGGQLGSSGPGDLVSGTGFRAGLGISFLF